MSGKKYFECAICGTKYEACYSCNRKDPSLSWKNVCDTAEHYKIFQVVNGYTAGMYTKEEAAKKLKNVNLSDLESLRDNIKTIIKKILEAVKDKVEDDKTEDNSEPAVNDATENIDNENVEPVVAKQTRRRKQTSVN